MNPEQQLLDALQALGEGDRDRQASGATEVSLTLAFRRHNRVRRLRQLSTFTVAAGIVIAIAATYFWGARPAKIIPARTEAAFALPAQPTPRPTPPASPVLRSTPRARTRYTVEREIATDFFPLMDVPPPVGRGALVRVNLPAEAMRTVGLPVREDRLSERVQADVLLSEEGLATAIRFVKVSQ
jgi:hypothetical protein